MDTQHYFNLFYNFCCRQDLSPNTTRAYQSDLRDFPIWLSSQDSQDLDREILETWLEEMQTRNYASTTIKRKLATLKVALNWLENTGYIKKNPFHGLKLTIKLPHRLPKALCEWRSKCETVGGLKP